MARLELKLNAEPPAWAKRPPAVPFTLPERLKTFGKGQACHIVTYGCQMNEHDSEVMLGILTGMGFTPTADPAEADVILLNTCAIRENAAEKVLGKTAELKVLKRHNPNLLIGVGGCLPQETGQTDRLLRHSPHLDLVFGTHNLHKLPELLEAARYSQEAVVDVWDSPQEMLESLPSVRADKLKAWVNISYGCNKMCTYCVVPETRGRERSRMPEDIVAEVQGLAAAGYKEVTLLGQTVNSYGHDLGRAYTFAGLLRQLDDTPGLERIRYMSSHPRDFSRDLIETIAASRTVCEHFHMPVQAGSNAVLRAMRRNYRIESYLKLIEDIRSIVPGASITTDIIVGFPGETEEDFQETLAVVEQVRYDMAFTFAYSPREGTPAAQMPNQVPEEVKHERLQRLMAVQNQISWEQNQKMTGQTVEVLIEGPSKKDPAVLMGRTRTNKVVLFPGPDEWIGQLRPVRINVARSWTLHGEAV